MNTNPTELSAHPPSPEASAPYSMDADPAGIRAMVADTITGAMAFGLLGVNPPPDGHWLAPFWAMAWAERSAAAPQPASCGEVVAWRATTEGLRKFITDATYRRFSAEIQRWYEPYRCASCGTAPPSAPVDEVSEVTRQLVERDQAGHAKYGTTLDRTDLSPADWLQHMAEELLDAAGYALAAKREILAQQPAADFPHDLLLRIRRATVKLGWSPVDASSGSEAVVRQLVRAIEAIPQQPAAVDEAMVFRLAVWMARHDGHDDPHHLIWEGSPPEPWGEVWNRYEDDARSALTAALAAQQGGRDDG